MPRRFLVPVLLMAAMVAIAACGTPADRSTSAAGPTATPGITNAPGILTCADKQSDPIKCSTPPPGWTLPPPRPCDHTLRTTADIKGVVRPSQSPADVVWGNQLGAPVLVRPLQTGRLDLYLVPHVNASGAAEWVTGIEVSAPERGCVAMGSGWGGVFPALNEDAARQLANTQADHVVTSEAVYLPFIRSGLPYSSEVHFVWRIVRASGAEVFVFSGGEVMSGPEVRGILSSALLGIPLRPRS